MSSARNGQGFSSLLKRWQTEETDKIREKGWVPAMLYFLVSDSGEILGAIHFRYELNDRLRQCGGHIGYGIRPSVRGRGLGTQMLALIIEEVSRKDGYSKILITCDDDNPASAKVIEKNGGQLEEIIIWEGKRRRQYWVSV